MMPATAVVVTRLPARVRRRGTRWQVLWTDTAGKGRAQSFRDEHEARVALQDRIVGRDLLESIDERMIKRLASPGDVRYARNHVHMLSPPAFDREFIESRYGEREVFAYIVHAGGAGHLKFGVSVEPERRVGALQVGHSEKLEMLAYGGGGREAERWAHITLRDHRLHGEWFAPSPKVLVVAGLLMKRWQNTKKERAIEDARIFHQVANSLDFRRDTNND